MNKVNVLMVCTGNICRSPMAAAILPANLPDGLQRYVQVASAGTHAHNGLPAEPQAIAVMAARGVDIRSHRSRRIDAALIDWADWAVVMETVHSDLIRRRWPTVGAIVVPISRYSATHPSVDIPDPYGGSTDDYRLSAARIDACLENLIDDLRRVIE